MRVCIVKLASDTVYSLVADGQLIFHCPLDSVSQLPELLFRQEIDKLVFICQGIPVPTKTNDCYKISSLNISGRDVPLVIKDNDQVFFSELATALHIDNVVILSYTDYICNKFQSDGKIIVVDSYLGDYAVMYLEDGQIKDFNKVSSVNLSRKIGRFKDTYHAPVMSIYQRNEVIGIRTSLSNSDKIPDDQLFSLDYIPYCLQAKGKSLLNNAVDSSFNWGAMAANLGQTQSPGVREEDNSNVESSLDDLNLEGLAQPRRKKSEKFKGFFTRPTIELDMEKKESVDKFTDTILSFAIVIVASIAVIGLISVTIFKGKVDLLNKEINTSQERIVSADDVNSYLDGDLDKSPASRLSKIYSTNDELKIASASYEYGDTTVTLLSETDEDQVKNEEVLNSQFKVTDKSFMGKLKQGGKTYNKTKYILDPQSF